MQNVEGLSLQMCAEAASLFAFGDGIHWTHQSFLRNEGRALAAAMLAGRSLIALSPVVPHKQTAVALQTVP